MEYDQEKVDEVALAFLFLTMHKDGSAVRAWKGFDWAVLDRLHEKGWISDPKSKAKSVIMTDEGEALAGRLFAKHFGTAG
ncbi:MAG: hypothetical protein HY700_14245 [Gemmatimonadetes bacterium]|nr:hypothetical protein [Gemmatimonadota bacterium]